MSKLWFSTESNSFIWTQADCFGWYFRHLKERRWRPTRNHSLWPSHECPDQHWTIHGQRVSVSHIVGKWVCRFSLVLGKQRFVCLPDLNEFSSVSRLAFFHWTKLSWDHRGCRRLRLRREETTKYPVHVRGAICVCGCQLDEGTSRLWRTRKQWTNSYLSSKLF